MLIMKRIQWLMEALMLSVIEFMYLFLVFTLLCVVLVLLFDIDSEKVHWLPYVWNVHSQSIKQFIFKCKKHTPCSVSQQFTLHWRNDLHNESFYKCRKTLKYVPKHGIGIMSLHWDLKLITKKCTTFCQWSTEIGGSPLSESQVAFTNVCLHPNDTGDLHLVCPYETRGGAWPGMTTCCYFVTAVMKDKMIFAVATFQSCKILWYHVINCCTVFWCLESLQTYLYCMLLKPAFIVSPVLEAAHSWCRYKVKWRFVGVWKLEPQHGYTLHYEG